MRVRSIGVIGAVVLGAALAANAQSTSSSGGSGSSQSSASQSPTQTPSTQSSGKLPSTDSSATSSSPSSAKQMPSSQADSATRDLSTQSSPTQEKMQAKTELSGVVKKVDPTTRSVKISSSTGGEQELTLSPKAAIMRDGNQISLDQLKEGDRVQASFDPSSSEATRIHVESEQSTDQSKTDQSKTDQSKTKSDTAGEKGK
jgi:Cu/Ag efflux protein CusF